MKRHLFCSIVSLVVLHGCAADIAANNDESPPPAEAYSLTIWNRSQFPIQAIQLVDVPPRADDPTPEAMDEVQVWSDNEPALQMEGTVVVSEFVSGSRVAFRRERAAGADPIEVQSVEGFVIDQNGYTLVLFDDSFRLLYPWSEDNPSGAPREQ